MKSSIKSTIKNNTSEFLLVSFFALFSFFAFVIPLQPAAAAIDLGWEVSQYTLSDGAVGGTANFFNVTDTSFANAVSDTITVTVQSIKSGGTVRDSITMTLFEIDDPSLRSPDPSTGIFGITNIVFNPDTARFSIGDTAVVTKEVTSLASNGITNTISLKVNSTTTTGGIQYILTESGDTGVFTGTLLFSSSTSVANSTIKVSAGDIVSVKYNDIPANIAIVPSSDGSTSGLIADVGDTIRVTYQGFTADTTICTCGGPGGGGGGLVRPGLVLDVAVALTGGTDSDTSPPSFALSSISLTSMSLPDSIMSIIHLQDPFKPLTSITDDSTTLPFKIGNNGYALYGYSQTIETSIAETGIPIPLQLNLQDDTGVEHVALYTNIIGDEEVQNSDTYIIYHEDKPLEITDPHGLFFDVDFIENKTGTKYAVLFNITFAKPMDTSDIIFRLWDEKRNSGDTKIFDAIKVMGEPIIKPSEQDTIQVETARIDLPYYKDPKLTISFPDYDGNLVYYDSFGNMKRKQTHPYHDPHIYPDYVGKMKRMDDEFRQLMIAEDMEGRLVAQTLIGNPIKNEEDKIMHMTFYYPSIVGKLDRENIVTLNYTMADENIKALRYCITNYGTNHIED